MVAAPAPAAAKRRPRAKAAASADNEAEEVMSPAVLPKVRFTNSTPNKLHQEVALAVEYMSAACSWKVPATSFP